MLCTYFILVQCICILHIFYKYVQFIYYLYIEKKMYTKVKIYMTVYTIRVYYMIYTYAYNKLKLIVNKMELSK